MTRKIWIILIAFAAILIVNNLQVFGSSGLGSFIDLMLTLFIIYRAYVLYKKPVGNKLLSPAKITTPIITVAQAKPGTASELKIIALIFVLVFITAGYQVVGAAGFNFFVWGDHILDMDNSNKPVLMWALAGLLFGSMTGSLVIWRKYHIRFQWCLVTIIPFLSLLFVLQASSDPLQSIEPRPLVVTTDSAKTTPADSTPVMPKRKRQNVTQPIAPIDTAEQQVAVAASCATQLANVSINARTDSVNIYYRTANVQNGPWSAWKLKFVPQQGQFSLTDGGQVRANSLQYYYQAKLVWMRSAQDPFTLAICDKPLVIDTY